MELDPEYRVGSKLLVPCSLFDLAPSMELDGQGNLRSEEKDDRGIVWLRKNCAFMMDCVSCIMDGQGEVLKLLSKYHEHFNEVLRIFSAKDPMKALMAWYRHQHDTNYDTEMPDFQAKIRKILGFVLVVLFIYQYLMGYLERGQWNTYSNGAWEFRATYVCIELRLGSYPFQKFRVRPSSGYSGVTVCRNKNSIMYEPWITLNGHKFPFKRQETAYRAALLRDVAKFCLRIEGKDYNFSEVRYAHLRQIPTRYSESEIRSFVEETFKLLQIEEALNAETPTWQAPNIVNGDQIVLGGVADVQQQDAISDQPLHVELGTFGSVEDQEQPADMAQELQHADGLQSSCANLELAGPTIEENIREHPEALISSAGPSLIQPKGTSKITLIAPCNGTGGVDLFTELKVFRKENWNAKTGAGATSSCALEGCSAAMHEFTFLQKSGENQELWPENICAKLDAFQDRGWKIELLGNGRRAFISSAGPSLIQSGCTSQITLIPPCNGTGAVNDLFTELKVFRKENWKFKTGEGATSSCALEGCSSTVHEFAFFQKSGENQELWPVDIWAKLDAFEDHGWKIELLENGRRAT